MYEKLLQAFFVSTYQIIGLSTSFIPVNWTTLTSECSIPLFWGKTIIGDFLFQPSEYFSNLQLCKLAQTKTWSLIVLSKLKRHWYPLSLSVTLHLVLVKPFCYFTLRETCPNTGFFLVRIFLYSDWIRTRKNSIFGHFSRSVKFRLFKLVLYLTRQFQTVLLDVTSMNFSVLSLSFSCL